MTVPPRSLLGALLLSVVLALLSPVAPAEAASRTLCTGYVGCAQSGHPHYGYKKAGSKMWWRMYAGHNCTNYVAYRLVKQGMSAERPWDGTGMAYNWGRANRRITDTTPMVGSVAWWNAGDGVGSSGHVAYVEKVLSNRKIVISEDSWGGDFHWREIRKGDNRWPTGFIHFDDREVAAVAPPALAGRPAVGGQLTLDVGRWKPTADLAVQWLVGNKPIGGATGTTFVPGPEHLGKRLSAKVSATARGYVPGSATTALTGRVRRGAMTVATRPTLSGTARVDEVLTLSPGAASPAGESREIRWYADGTLIQGESGLRLRLGQQLIRKRITATVVWRREAYRARAATTEATGPVKAGRFQVTEPFTVAGRAHLGRQLTVRRGTYTPADADVSYTWLRDGTPIPGATGPTYVAQVEDVGHRLGVGVLLRRQGYLDATQTLATPSLVTTPATLRVTARGRPHRAVVKVRVTAPGVTRPDGSATVRIGKRVVRGEVSDGRLRAVFRDLPRGRYTIRVRYRGTEVVRPARATTTVRVPRR